MSIADRFPKLAAFAAELDRIDAELELAEEAVRKLQFKRRMLIGHEKRELNEEEK